MILGKFWETACKRCSVKNMFLKISQNSQKNSCVRVFFNKVAVLRSATLLKKRLWHRCSLVSFARFLRTPFFIEHLRWWLLNFAWFCVLFIKVYFIFPIIVILYLIVVSIDFCFCTFSLKPHRQIYQQQHQTTL